MTRLNRLLSQISPEDRQFYNWQFALAQRIAQIMEAKGLNQREFAKRSRLTEAHVSALLHAGANPSLSTLARISALLDVELLTWKHCELLTKYDAAQAGDGDALAAVFSMEENDGKAESEPVD